MHSEEIEKNIGYTFKNKQLLQTALTHTSYANTHGVESNEKLEYLGDSILEFITSKYLYNNYKKLKEGEMTKLRATVVCEESLYKIAIKLGFTEFIITGKSEKNEKGVTNKAILADSIEAVIAAIYLDSNLENAENFIIRNLKEPIEIASKNVGIKDYKTVLQEKLQIHGNVKIEYEIIFEKGPDHDKYFVAQVTCDDKILAKGERKKQEKRRNGGCKKCTRKYERIRRNIFRNMKIENELFIGSLTGLSKENQIEVLDKSRDLENKRFDKIKVAISPKEVTKELLKTLKVYKISTIELEVQSTNEYILKKCGYNFTMEDVKKAVKKIKWNRFKLSFQVGIGLPDSTKQDEINTAKEIAKLKPDKVRIYPMVVVKNTSLEKEYKEGKYEPLILNQAIERCKDVIYEFNRKKIKQISIVKQNELNKSKEKEVVAGPYHDEFAQLVTDSIWYDSIADKIKKVPAKVKKVKIEVNPKELLNIEGYKRENAIKLKEVYDVDIKAEGNPKIKVRKVENKRFRNI